MKMSSKEGSYLGFLMKKVSKLDAAAIWEWIILIIVRINICMIIYFLNKAYYIPLAIGVNINILTHAAPCVCPKMVTLFGSPPNSWIFSWIQCKAATWSIKPKFPRELPSRDGKNPVSEKEREREIWVNSKYLPLSSLL